MVFRLVGNMKARSITILGATGSIGTSTLDLVLRNAAQFEVVALTAQSDVAGLAKAARAVNARHAVIGDEARLPELRAALAGTPTTVAGGKESITEAAQMGADYTMCAIVGCAGLQPVMAALAGGKTVALANKEALVSAGDLMIAAGRSAGATLLPVDSEHNAIFQCLAGNSVIAVSRIILTASGGPFRTLSRAEMARLTPAQAVKHPNWTMGAKISVDSATMMNKGLELIEAHHLFPTDASKFEILVHPQSIVHSMVEYVDGSVLAQLGTPDMRTPIAHTLAWPERMVSPSPPLNLAEIGRLDFEAPDPERFPALRLARAALDAGGAAPAILNAANEVAVAAFLAGTIGFLDIAARVEAVLARLTPVAPQSLEDVLAIDAEARHTAHDLIEKAMA
jgi:1-deoxy-D-xylulose-5-phosphate reductoisomerase